MQFDEMGGPPGNDSKQERYFRHAVKGHWDPYTIDLSHDYGQLADLDRRSFTQFRAMVAMFGAGEEAVVEDLIPLAMVVGTDDDQRFIASHLYEEAKHSAFFDRYWSEVINPAEEACGLESTSPTADHWFPDAYQAIFDRTEAAMYRLLEADTPENRASAYTHYHLVVEGVFAQTGFHTVQGTFGPKTDGPTLPGLLAGFKHIRQDEGRHVGFGLEKLGELLRSGKVDYSLIEETVSNLADPVDDVVKRMGWERLPGSERDELAAYATNQRQKRLRQLTEQAETSVPDDVSSRNGGVE